MQCSKCNHQEVDGSRFCTNCGEQLEIVENQKSLLNFCSGCGIKREIDANFCLNCGYNFVEQKGTFQEDAATAQGAAQGTSSGTFTQQSYVQARNTPSAATNESYATFGQRVLASLIDWFINFIFILIFSLLFLSNSYDLEGKVQFWGFIFGLAYKAGMESSSIQGTLGKKAMGIKVTNLQGNRISFPRALGRFFLVLSLSPYLRNRLYNGCFHW